MSLLLDALQNPKREGEIHASPLLSEQAETLLKASTAATSSVSSRSRWQKVLYPSLGLAVLIAAAWVVYPLWLPHLLSDSSPPFSAAPEVAMETSPTYPPVSEKTASDPAPFSSNSSSETPSSITETAPPTTAQSASDPSALPSPVTGHLAPRGASQTNFSNPIGPEPDKLPEEKPPSLPLPSLPADSRIVISRRGEEGIIPTKPVPENRDLKVTLHSAYQAWQDGRWTEAAEAYRALLAIAPDHPDVLLGNALVALHEQKVPEATALLRRLLTYSPFHPQGVALLATLTSGSDPLADESRLRQTIASAPNQPEPYHALGKLLAAQQRWPEAQQLFFQAMTLAPHQPAYRYDLAVSLDHLGQYATALTYYREALRLNNPAFSPFPVTSVRERIQILQTLVTEENDK